MKNRKVIIAAALILLLAVGSASAYFLTQSGEPEKNTTVEEDVMEISPDDVGFDYELREDDTGITLTFSSLEDVETLEYDLTYTREIETEDGTTEALGGVPGEFDVSDRDEFETEIDFGTCSSGVCTYDTIVSDEISLIVKATFENGENGIFEEQIPLE